MPTSVVMPQMGESIAEGTIVRWIKKVGEPVVRDEPLFEISTDKVDAEIPAPAAGVLLEIKVNEGETVPVNSVVAMIGAEGEGVAPAGREPAGAPPPREQAEAPPKPQADGDPRAQSSPAGSSRPAAAGGGEPALPEDEDHAPAADEPRGRKSSPLVRRIAKEHDVDLTLVRGSGIGGRVTKQDILGYLESRETKPAPAPSAPAPSAVPAQAPGERVEVVPMSVMRRRIAEHMVASRRTSAHVHSVFEVDFSRVAAIRAAKNAAYEQAGAKLTYLSFIAKAAVDALRASPIVNASVDGDNIVYKKDINLGIAVALEWGLIVPVIRHADEKNMLGLSRAIQDLADRARAKQLKPEEVQGGTFTITNPGTFGAQFGLPIINQPQLAILGVGAIEKRVIVVNDAIAIRPLAYLTLGYDHRIIDGAVADQFMSVLKRTLESFDAGSV